MLEISAQHISDAQQNDLSAITFLLQAMDGRVRYYAREAARVNGHYSAADAEDYEQIGREALWQAIDRFQGTTGAQFCEYAKQTIWGAVDDARKEARGHQGVSRSTMEKFERCLRYCDGDPHAAEEAAASNVPLGKWRLSESMARAARVAYQGGGMAAATTDEIAMSRMHSRFGIPGEEDEEPGTTSTDADRVQDVLSSLSHLRAWVLSAATGIGDAPDYGLDWVRRTNRETGEDESRWELRNPQAMAEDRGLTTKQISQAWIKGRTQFVTKWNAVYGIR